MVSFEGTLSKNIAVIGMACRFPNARTPEEFWNNIIHKVDTVTRFSDENLKKAGIADEHLKKENYVRAKPFVESAEFFDHEFFGFSKKEASFLDPQIRLFLEVAYHALEDACFCSKYSSSDVGVFAGASTSIEWIRHILQVQRSSSLSEEFESWVLSCKDFLSQIISYRLQLTGPSYTLYTACSTSLAAIHLACQSLLNNECRYALAGGVTIELPLRGGYLYEPGMIHSPTGKCSPFDDAANGTIFGDGAGAVVLKRLEHAIRDHDNIYAVIKGSACNNDGQRKTGFFAPSVEGQHEVIEKVYQNSDILPSSIQFIETHGTGTKIGDPIEIEGLKMSHSGNRNNPCFLGSVKANIGHLHTSAGIAGLIKTILSLQNEVIPGLTNFTNLNKEIVNTQGIFEFPKDPIAWNAHYPKRAAISSFGIGGTNIHLVVEQAPLQDQLITTPMSKPYLFPLSARSVHSLKQLWKEFFDFIEKDQKLDLESLAYTLQVGKESFEYRKMILASDLEKLIKQRDTLSQPLQSSSTKSLILFCSPFEEIDIALFKEQISREAVSAFYLDLIGILKRELTPTNFEAFLRALTSNQPLKNPSILKLAKFIYSLIQIKYLLSLGLKFERYFGDLDDAFLAALCSSEEKLDLVLRHYLIHLGIDKATLDSVETKEVEKIIQKCELKKFSVSLYPHRYFLFLGHETNLEHFGISSGIAYSKINNSLKLNEENIAKLISNIWESGVEINWEQFHKGKKYHKIKTPHYSFNPIKFSITLSEKNSFSKAEDKKSLPEMEWKSLIKQIVSESLNIHSFTNEDNFYKLGADSLQVIQIVSRINADLGVDISLEEVFKTPNLKTIENAIRLQGVKT